MDKKQIPRSKRIYKGFYIQDGLNSALKKACKKMGMSHSEFIRYCLMRILSELSLISEEVHRDERNNQN